MAYYMSVDGGGTKIAALLYDQEFNLLGVGNGGPVNSLSEPIVSVEASIVKCIDECVAGRTGIELDRVNYAVVGSGDMFMEVLKQRVKVKQSNPMSEGKIGILAAIQKREGLLALAGTGSGIFEICRSHETYIGGWGNLLGDEGSGYYVGRAGIVAAIKSHEGLGPQTTLQAMLLDRMKLNEMSEIFPAIYKAQTPRNVIASAAKIVAEAARNGDRVAIQIMAEAGQELADQLAMLLDQRNYAVCPPITVSGSVWKGHGAMFERFAEAVRARRPDADIAMPLFEPVVGGVIMEAMNESDTIDAGLLARLKHNFNSYLYGEERS